jgi:hypothetical protein
MWLHGPVEAVLRSTLNPVSLFEASVQERRMLLLDVAVADKPVGGAGSVVTVSVVPIAVLE